MPWSTRCQRIHHQIIVGIVVVALVLAACLVVGLAPAGRF